MVRNQGFRVDFNRWLGGGFSRIGVSRIINDVAGRLCHPEAVPRDSQRRPHTESIRMSDGRMDLELKEVIEHREVFRVPTFDQQALEFDGD